MNGRQAFALAAQYVGNVYGVSVVELRSSSRVQERTAARQLAMFLIRKCTVLSTTEIGLLFGGRDHSTVLASVNRVREKMVDDAAYLQVVRDGEVWMTREPPPPPPSALVQPIGEYDRGLRDGRDSAATMLEVWGRARPPRERRMMVEFAAEIRKETARQFKSRLMEVE